MDYKEQVISAYENFVSNKDISGYKSIVEYINNANPNLVIDAGCGNNIFKGTIQNIKGFDARDIVEADYQGTFQDMDNIFLENKADFVLSFGSLGFGNQAIIQDNLQHIYRWLKPDGLVFVVEIPEYDITEVEKNKFPLKYFWNVEKVKYFTGILGFKIESEPVLNLGKLNWIWKK